MKIAFVYDRVTKSGGAERVLMALHEIWPKAPLYTAFHNPKGAVWSANWQVISSFLQKIPFANKRHEFFPWATPIAFESFSFDDYDVIISVTSAEAKAILTKPGQLHICYCLTPTRYLWSHENEYRQNLKYYLFGSLLILIFSKFIQILKKWDVIASKRPDAYIAVSQHVKKRIAEYYQIPCYDVIYPPVDEKLFVPSKNQNRPNEYFLLVSRAVYYKRLDIVIQAFNKLKLPLVVITQGQEKNHLKSIAYRNVRFLSRYLTDEELARYYQNCRAFVYAGDEDFGLVALEAQACGKPVIAYRKSGVAEIVVHNKTGLLYSKQTQESLIEAINKFQKMNFSEYLCRLNAKRFSLAKFKHQMKYAVETLYIKHSLI